MTRGNNVKRFGTPFGCEKCYIKTGYYCYYYYEENVNLCLNFAEGTTSAQCTTDFATGVVGYFEGLSHSPYRKYLVRTQ